MPPVGIDRWGWHGQWEGNVLVKKIFEDTGMMNRKGLVRESFAEDSGGAHRSREGNGQAWGLNNSWVWNIPNREFTLPVPTVNITVWNESGPGDSRARPLMDFMCGLALPRIRDAEVGSPLPLPHLLWKDPASCTHRVGVLPRPVPQLLSYTEYLVRIALAELTIIFYLLQCLPLTWKCL